MGFIEFNNETGLNVKSKANILQELKTIFKTAYGNDYEIVEGTELYSLIDLLSTELAQTGAAAKAVYDAFSFTTATGTPLDALCSLSGISRNDEESDNALRARHYTSLYRKTVGPVEGIKARLLEHTYTDSEGVIRNSVENVRIENNNTTSDLSVLTTNDFKKHSIIVVCQLNSLLTSQDSNYTTILTQLSDIVNNYKSLGCGVSLAAEGYSITVAAKATVDFDIEFGSFSGVSLPNDVKNSFINLFTTTLTNYINSLNIGEDIVLSAVYKCVVDTGSQLGLTAEKCPTIHSAKFNKNNQGELSLLAYNRVSVEINEYTSAGNIQSKFLASE